MTDLFSLKGRVAFITGASRGLGLGMAKGLADAGATVVLTGRDRATLAAAAQEIGSAAEIAAFDATDQAATKAAIDAVVARHGRLDILVANAGTHGAAKLPDWTPTQWDHVLQTNLAAAFFAAQAASSHMVAAKHGRIIFTGSLTGSRGRPTIHGYAASKAALAAIARTLANELGEHGITVNTIAPGYFETELSAGLRRDTDFVARMTARIPLRRWGTPADLAGIAVFLASDASAYITGQELYVDGGLGASL
jgi:gluconate 5-dehydrogenase